MLISPCSRYWSAAASPARINGKASHDATTPPRTRSSAAAPSVGLPTAVLVLVLVLRGTSGDSGRGAGELPPGELRARQLPPGELTRAAGLGCSST